MQDIQLAIEPGVDLMKDIVAAGYSFLKDKNKERDFFGAATRRYVKNLLDDYGSVRVLGMEDEVPLDSLYVRANIIEKITSRSGILPEEMEQERERYLSAFGKAIETVDGEEIVNREQKFIVLGKPGAGKTTYLKYLTLRMISKDKKSRIKKRKLPIFITLREWADKKMSLLDFIVEQFDLCGFEEARHFVERMLANGDCLLLLDGLDEVSRDTRLDDIIQQVIDFTRKYRDCQFIASCRVAAYNHWFEKFKDVEIADFNEKQIEQFVRNFFRKEPKTADECWEKLKNNQPLKEMASVPLLLTLICLSYNPEKRDFPQKRSSLYREAIKLLLEKWDESRPGGRVKRDEIYKNLSRQNKEAMFARIAWGTFTENQYFIEEEQLGRMIQNFINNLPEYCDEKALPDGERILKQIEAQHGIFLERAKGVYSFAHLTFQEYFTAKFIVDHVGQGTLERLVSDHFYDDRWLEVYLLTAGKLGNRAEEFILLMQQKNRQLLKEMPELDELLKTVQTAILMVKNKYPFDIRESASMLTALAFRLAGALCIDLSGPTFDFDITWALEESYNSSSYNHTLILNLIRAYAFNLDLILALDYAYSHALGRTVRDTLNLALKNAIGRFLSFNPRDISNLAYLFDLNPGKFHNIEKKLTTEIVEKINDYLKGNIWIVNCMNSGALVSAPVREKVLHDLLKPI